MILRSNLPFYVDGETWPAPGVIAATVGEALPAGAPPTTGEAPPATGEAPPATGEAPPATGEAPTTGDELPLAAAVGDPLAAGLPPAAGLPA